MYKQIRGVSISEVGTAILFVILSAVMWWGAAGFFERGVFFGVFAIGTIGSAVTLAVLHIIEGTHAVVRRLGLLFGFLLSVPVAFQDNVLTGILLALLGAVVAEVGAFRVHMTRKSFRTVSFGAITHAAMPFYFSALSIVLSVLMFVSPVIGRVILNPIPESWLRVALNAANPFVQSTTGFPISGTIDQIASQISGSKDPRVIAVVRSNLEKRVGFPVSGKEDFAALLSKTMERQLENIREKFGKAFRFGFLIGAFILFRVLFVPFGWFAVMGAYAMTKLLKSWGGAIEFEEPIVRLSLRWP